MRSHASNTILVILISLSIAGGVIYIEEHASMARHNMQEQRIEQVEKKLDAITLLREFLQSVTVTREGH